MSTLPLALEPGTFIQDLQINGVLGSGTAGITYLVSDTAIGTQFALKEYLPAGGVTRLGDGTLNVDDEKAKEVFRAGLADFLNEGRLLAGLDHPHIVRILRYFEANGTAYFLMPYYPGRPLHEILQSAGRLSPERSRDLMLGLMDGLAYIHQHGVIHQDVKPANVYVGDEHGPILLDFGIASSGAHPAADRSGRGSPGYAALEQSAADGVIGPWTDIYGLAATLYRCLSGTVPPAAVNRQAAIENGGVDPLKPLGELVADSRAGGLVDAIELGLKLLPQERPRNVPQWKKSFQGVDWRRSVAGRGDLTTDAEEGREWLPRILLGIFILAMGAIGVFLLTHREQQSPPPAPGTSAAEPAVSAPPSNRPGTEEIRRWHDALDADTVGAYRRFIKDYPQSVYVAQARVQLNILDDKAWQELQPEDTVPAYQDYLKSFPDGRHEAEAMERIDALKKAAAKKERERKARIEKEKAAWQTASDTHTIAAMDKYIKDWPAGQHVEEARHLRSLLKNRRDDAAAFAAAQKLDNKAAYQAYIDAFPKGAGVTAALERLDQLTLRPGKTFKDCSQCPEMTVVPAGNFWQGSEDSSPLALGMEKPRHAVTINQPFAVGTYEVTMAEWDACVDDGGCSVRPGDNGWGRGRRPVIMISWNDAGEYVHWLSDKTGQSYRLPSESEWEYFARAGETSDWLGGDPAKVCRYGNIAGRETGFQWRHKACADGLALGTAPAGSYLPNAFGLYDVIGNVAEWTADCMNLSYVDAPADGSAWGRGLCSSHMTRGGSWFTGTRDIRLPARFNLKNGDRNDFTGLRVVRSIKE